MARTWWIVGCVWLLGFSSVIAQTAHRGSIEPGSLLLQLEANTDPEKLVAQFQQLGGVPTTLRVEKPLAPDFDIWELSFNSGFPQPESLLKQLQLHPAVRAVQFNHRIQFRELIPNDPSFSSQWYLHNSGSGNQLLDADIDAEIAWNHSNGATTLNGDTIVIAQIDDGTSLSHPDLIDNTWKNPEEIPNNGIDDDQNGYIDDHLGWNVSAGMDLVQYGVHGVKVAGIMGATTNNSIGVSGLAWHSKIMHVVGISNLESEAIEGFYYVWNARKLYNESQGTKGALVVAINTSWGVNGGQPSDFPLWCGMIDSLGQQGVLTVAATANEDWNIDQVGDIPTACPSDYLISVTATDAQDQRTFAAYGPEHIDLAAPGDSLLTTAGSNNYEYATGTSFAAPLVSGSLALLYGMPCSNLQALVSESPATAAKWVRSVLLNTVDPVASLEEEVKSGGRLNVGAATTLVDQLCNSCPTWTPLQVDYTSSDSIKLHWNFLQYPDEVQLHWRAEGQSTWIPVPLNPDCQKITLSDLPTCQNIESQLRWMCGSIEYQSESLFFSSPGCCIAPEEISTSAIGSEGLLCTWEPQQEAQGYLVHLRPVGTVSWSTYPTPHSSIELHGLLSCFPYEVQIVPICLGVQVPVGPIHIVQTGGCNSCTQLDYCVASANESNFEWIESVRIDNFVHPTGPNSGYADFTGVPVPLSIDNPHILSLTPGALQPDYAAIWRVWIDLNQDGDFSDPNELLFAPESAQIGTIFHPFQLPTEAQTGVTRMRIMMTWEDAPPLNACGNFDYGEVEDYCVYIAAEDPLIDCPSAPQMLVLESNEDNLALTWDPAPHDFGYQIRWRELGQSNWEVTTSFIHQTQLEQLSPCTDYEISVQRICLSGLSGFSTPEIITTGCPSGTASISNLQVAVFPNPFNEVVQISFTAPKENVRCRVFTATGQLVLEQMLTDGHLEGMSSFSTGLYLLCVQPEGEDEIWIKLVKE